MTRHDGDPDDDLVGSLLRRSDGPVFIRPLLAPARRGPPPYAAILAATLVVVVVAGVAGVSLNARRRDVAVAPSPSAVAIQTSPSGANLAPQAGRGFVVNLGGHGIGIRTEADAVPYFQVTSRTLLSYAVSADGKLAYWQTGPDDALPHALHVYDPATRADRTVLTLTDERGGSSGFMVWSTDGGGLAIGTSDVGSAFEGQRAPSRPTVATWSLLDVASGARRKISTISGAWVVPVSWDRQTDIATAIESGRDGPSTPTRLFYVWNPKRAAGKASQFVLPAAIDPYSVHADSAATYIVGVERLPCAPSTCQSVWTWPAVEPTAAIARTIPGHTLGLATFRPGTTDLFAVMSPLCCTTPPPTERPTIVELGPPASSTLRIVYTYSPGDANFFFRSDGTTIVVNNGDLNNRKGITVVDPTTGTTILLPVDRDGVQDVIGSIGPGPVRSIPSPAPPVSPVTLPTFTGDASSVSGLRTNALGQLGGNWTFVGRWLPVPHNTTIDVQVWAVPLAGGAPKPVFAYEAPSGGIPEAVLDNAPYLRRQFSPDGKQFVVSIDAQLVIIDLPTGQARRLGIAGYFPSWSKDGSQIAYLAEKASAGGATPDHVIYAIPSAGGAPRELLNIGSSANAAEWSPDGSQLLIGAADGITILDGRTGAIVRRLTGTSASGSSIAQWRASTPQITLLESACGQRGSATTRLVTLDGSGAPERVAFDTLSSCGTVSLSDPRWNPASGNQVLFVGATIAGGTANFGVHVVDVASNTDTTLPLNASEATWTWDGQQIVYLEKTRTTTPHGQSLHLASRDGRNDQLLLREDGSFFFSVASLAY